MKKIGLAIILSATLALHVYAETHELVKNGVYDEDGKCLEPAVYIVHPHEFTMYDYKDRPDLAGQGMPKKKKSAWKKLLEANPKKVCDEEDVKEENAKECAEWHKHKKERVDLCERLLREGWGEEALKWARLAVDIKHDTRMAVSALGMLNPIGAAGATFSEYAWTFIEGDVPRLFSEVSQDFAEAEYNRTLEISTAELGRKGQGGGLDVTIKNYGPGRAGNFHNAKIDAIHKEAVATKSANTGMKNLGKALPYVSMGSLNVEYGIDLAKLEDLEKQHGVAYRKCVEAINELKATKCPLCGIQ